MLIIHGENTVQSRKILQEKIDAAHSKKVEVFRLDAKKLTPSQLQESLGSSDLFGSEKLIVIEELHSLPTSQRKKDLIELLSKTNTKTDTETILWEKRSLTKTMLKPFGLAVEKECKPSNYLFSWLDMIGSTDKKKTVQAFHTALAHEDEMFCFIMFIRQIRMLIQAKDNTPIAGPPFMITKLKKQAQSLTIEKLLQIHATLLEIDTKIKTSKLRNTVTAELDLIQLSM